MIIPEILSRGRIARTPIPERSVRRRICCVVMKGGVIDLALRLLAGLRKRCGVWPYRVHGGQMHMRWAIGAHGKDDASEKEM